MKRLTKIGLRQLPLLVFLAAVLLTAYTAYCYPGNFIDSDLSSELVLGHLLSEQGRLVTTDWFYSTEIRVFNTNLVFAPLTRLFGDWQTVRFAASLVFMLLELAAYAYLARQAKIGRSAFFLSAGLMLLPIGVMYGRLFLYQNYYSPYMAYGFFLVGLYLSLRNHRGQVRLRQGLRMAAMVALAFVSCVNGFRQFPFTMLPVLLLALAAAIHAGRAPGGKRLTLDPAARQPLWTAAALFAAGLAGLAAHQLILPHFSNFSLSGKIALRLASWEQIRYMAESYLGLFGFQAGRRLWTLGGAANVAGLCAAAATLVLAVSAIFRREASPARALLRRMYPAAMGIALLIFLFSSGNENYPQYFLMPLIWVTPLLGLYFDDLRLAEGKRLWKRLPAAALCLCLLTSGVFHALYCIRPEGKQVIYDPYTFIRADYKARQEGAVAFLLANGYEIGYASFWQANSVTEATDGRVPMIDIRVGDPGGAIAYSDWLTDKRLRARAAVEGKQAFLLLTPEEAERFSGTPLAAQAERVYADAYSVLYALFPPTAVWDALAAQAAPEP